MPAMNRLHDRIAIFAGAAYPARDDPSQLTAQTIYPDLGGLALNCTMPVA
jgi:hypothetical protein